MAMTYAFDNVVERDIDLLVLDRFYTSPLLNLFLEAAGLDGYELVNAVHSDVDPVHGESDIVAVVRKDADVHGLLIENKITAGAQPDQYERYHIRAKERFGDKYAIFLIAPEAYLASNYEAQHKYEHCISYEKMRDECFRNDPYAFALLSKAVEKKSTTISSLISPEKTAFWHAYFDYQQQFAPDIPMLYSKRNHGYFSDWPHFKISPPIKKLEIIHKPNYKGEDYGTVELEFEGAYHRIDELKATTQTLLSPEMFWKRAGKSASLCIKVPKMDFSHSFEEYEAVMPEILSAVRALQGIVQQLRNMNGI